MRQSIETLDKQISTRIKDVDSYLGDLQAALESSAGDLVAQVEEKIDLLSGTVDEEVRKIDQEILGRGRRFKKIKLKNLFPVINPIFKKKCWRISFEFYRLLESSFPEPSIRWNRSLKRTKRFWKSTPKN
ncbi:hypothetical protein LEP1GSC085_2300 [Leptospira interrogans str. L0996]|nr:hypothetical protein LEP1GSC085_2300 [Leptospira interrogans str. L0996]